MRKALIVLALALLSPITARGDPGTCKFYYYDNECWTRSTGLMMETSYVIDSHGRLVQQSALPRKFQLIKKAYRILLESPSDAPLGEIWLVYSQLEDDIRKLRYKKWRELSKEIEIRPRRK